MTRRSAAVTGAALCAILGAVIGITLELPDLVRALLAGPGAGVGAVAGPMVLSRDPQ